MLQNTKPSMTPRAIKNRTLCCDPQEIERLAKDLVSIQKSVEAEELNGKIINADMFDIIDHLPDKFIDLLVLDPPYNLWKNYHGHLFKEKEKNDYQAWFQKVINRLLPKLKTQATIYVCSDWKTSALIFPILETYFYVRNRITWEREKGRGAKINWKNNTEDIWFCTLSDTYFFNVNAVKLKRKVLAPYTINGQPKDWQKEPAGNFRLTHPSNIWTDITIPFWSMAENTDHPTQKPEKLMAKLILASSKPNDFVFDPFLGSGTTAVVAKKTGRKYSGIELNKEYCCWALKRLQIASGDPSIQGYFDGVFWERNSLNKQAKN